MSKKDRKIAKQAARIRKLKHRLAAYESRPYLVSDGFKHDPRSNLETR